MALCEKDLFDDQTQRRDRDEGSPAAPTAAQTDVEDENWLTLADIHGDALEVDRAEDAERAETHVANGALFEAGADDFEESIPKRAGTHAANGTSFEAGADDFEESIAANSKEEVRTGGYQQMRELLRKRTHNKEKLAMLPEEFMAFGSGDAASSAPPWFVPRPQLKNAVLRLHEELLDFMQFMKQSHGELVARRKWVRTIRDACRSIWPACQVRVFGSSSTGLSLPNADVDVAILDVPCSPGEAMKLLADSMLAAREISSLELVESARVPVAKLRSRVCGLRADVVFNQANGLETSRFLRARMQEFPQLRPLILFLKLFLLQRRLNDTYTGGMGSFLLSNVVLHFLQRHPSGWDPARYAKVSLGQLLYDFFKYFGEEFQYEWRGISVLDGGRSFDKFERGSCGGHYHRGVHLCLESPMDPSVDVGGACHRMSMVKSLFAHGAYCLAHMFLQDPPVEGSMLCPLLLDASNPVVSSRRRLLVEQPVALLGVPCVPRGEVGGPGSDIAELDVLDDTEQALPVAKRRRTEAGGGAAHSEASGQTDFAVGCEASV